MEKSNSHLKDYKLAIEYKYLIRHAPSGVFLMPHMDDCRQFFGVIFMRRGLYRNGIFRFKLSLSPEYNDVDCPPVVVFTPPVFNPLIDMQV